jgi:hypothetical protein
MPFTFTRFYHVAKVLRNLTVFPGQFFFNSTGGADE